MNENSTKRAVRLARAVPVVLTAAAALVLLSGRPAEARMTNGSCTATATGSVTGFRDLAREFDWHLRNDDVVAGEGHPPGSDKLKGVRVRVDLFGLSVPVLGSDDEGTGGHAGPYTVATYSKIARIVGASGEAGGGACRGAIKIIVDDVNPLATAAGGGGAALGVLGLLGMVVAAFGRGGAPGRTAGAAAGLVSGAGFGLLLQQTGTLDPANAADLALPAAGLLAGALAAGILHRRPSRTGP